MAETNAVVLAAGKGTRMKSDLAKVLHPLAGKPLLAHVLENLAPIESVQTLVVVGHQAEQVAKLSQRHGAETVLQAEQLGTGHAVLQAREKLAGRPGSTLVVCGDVPLLRAATLRDLVETAAAERAAAAVLTAVTEDATGYGRILRDEAGEVMGIVEEKDATPAQRRIREYNTGTYCFENDALWSSLAQVGRDNAQGEFYLTDVVGILVQQGRRVIGVVCRDEREVQGVNSVADLARAERDLEAMERG